MKRLFLTAAFLLIASALGMAQDADHPSRGQGYFFIGPIVSNARNIINPEDAGIVFTPSEPLPADLFIQQRGGVSAGFGGEALIYKGLGIGAEAGYVGPDWSFSGSGAVGVGSIDASYHIFKKKRSRFEPFFVGGYNLYFGDRTNFQSGFNIGGGVNIWWAKHAALRLEVRDQGHINYFASQFTHVGAFRFGLTFR